MNAHSQFKKGFSLIAVVVLFLTVGAALTITISYLRSKQTKDTHQAPTTETKQVTGHHFIAEVLRDGQYIVYVQGYPTLAVGPKGLTTDDQVILQVTEEINPLIDSDEIIELAPAN